MHLSRRKKSVDFFFLFIIRELVFVGRRRASRCASPVLKEARRSCHTTRGAAAASVSYALQ